MSRFRALLSQGVGNAYKAFEHFVEAVDLDQAEHQVRRDFPNARVEIIEGCSLESLTEAATVMGEVNNPQTYPMRKRHRQMARAAIRVALRYGIEEKLILAEYEVVRKEESSRG